MQRNFAFHFQYFLYFCYLRYTNFLQMLKWISKSLLLKCSNDFYARFLLNFIFPYWFVSLKVYYHKFGIFFWLVKVSFITKVSAFIEAFFVYMWYICLLHIGSCQNCVSSMNLVTEIHLRLLNKWVLSTVEPCACKYVTLLQSLHRGTLSIHWYIAQNL